MMQHGWTATTADERERAVAEAAGARGRAGGMTDRVPANTGPANTGPADMGPNGTGPGAGGMSGAGGQFLAPREVMIVLPGLLLAILLAMLDNLIVSTALPRIVGDLGGVAHLSWVVTAYILASTITTPFYGKLGDMYGRKKLFIGAIIIFLIGSALSGLSQSMAELIMFRALQGLGAGGLMVGAMATLGDIVAPRERGTLHELHDGRHDARHHRRPAARRLHHHQLLLALDLLHQHPGGRRRAGLPDGRPARAGQEGQPQDRLPGRVAARRGGHVIDPARDLGRNRIPLGFGADHRPGPAHRGGHDRRSASPRPEPPSRCSRCTSSATGTSPSRWR